MNDFKYVSKEMRKPIKKNLIEIINNVQNYVREKFTFQFKFIGSDPLNMVTCDFSQNVGFDFDIDLSINDEDENYTAQEIRQTIKNAVDKFASQYGYDWCEDSTRVLTIKLKDRENSQIIHSCDIAIVNICEDGRKQYIRYNKKQRNYTWEFSKDGFELEQKIDWLKRNKLWEKTRYYYLKKKNNNLYMQKHSCSLRAEAITEMCQKYGFYQ